MTSIQIGGPQGQHIGSIESSMTDRRAEYTMPTAEHLIRQALRKRINSLDSKVVSHNQEDAFFVADLGEIFRQHLIWKQLLPCVKPFYEAVKCNPHPAVLELLYNLGTGFDCASRNEIEQILKLGADPERIIYAHPCKALSYIHYAKAVGVERMTFDNADELYKIKDVFPSACLLLRISTDDSTSHSPLSKKFGADSATVGSLLAIAQELDLNIIGVSFHVGSGASDPTTFVNAVRDANRVFSQASAFGFNLSVLDVGGGFCKESFENMAWHLRHELDIYFPSSRGIEIIAEPGRYYVASAFTLATSVIARRITHGATYQQNGHMIYIQDGTYGNFSGVLIDHDLPIARILRSNGKVLYGTRDANPLKSNDGVLYSIWGATCDGADCVVKTTRFKATIKIGDWLYFNNMGAYTSSSVTHFNGFPMSNDVVWVCSEVSLPQHVKG
ncbi:ornithine decarboxylase [Fusarium sp. NRRL 52700]|nr:ornithine decarboxylase [Fusarium sp. NRRL 52700]